MIEILYRMTLLKQFVIHVLFWLGSIILLYVYGLVSAGEDESLLVTDIAAQQRKLVVLEKRRSIITEQLFSLDLVQKLIEVNKTHLRNNGSHQIHKLISDNDLQLIVLNHSDDKTGLSLQDKKTKSRNSSTLKNVKIMGRFSDYQQLLENLKESKIEIVSVKFKKGESLEVDMVLRY